MKKELSWEKNSKDVNNSTTSWRKYTVEVAVPTIILTLVVATMYCVITMLCIAGKLPIWSACLLNTLLAYIIFTPLHEATHGNIKGNYKRLDWLEKTIGWIAGMMLWAPFPVFKILHLRHHSHTNDPEEDPDFWVASTNPFLVLFKCFSIIPQYYYHFFLKLRKDSKDNFRAGLVRE